MRILAWDVLFLVILLGHSVRSDEITSCEPKITINCGDYQIIIVAINTTTSMASDILELCNAHHECHVPNEHKECVRVSYWCRKNRDTVELKSASTIRLETELSLLGVTSDDYAQGKNQGAENVDCDIRFEDQQDEKKSMQFIIYEFAPFATSDEVCLSVLNSGKPPFCSGTRNIYTTYGPFDSTDGWKFNISVAKNVTSVPKIRFWIDIDVSKDAAQIYRLECYSTPVKLKTTDRTIELVTSVGTASSPEEMTLTTPTSAERLPMSLRQSGGFSWHKFMLAAAILLGLSGVIAAIFLWIRMNRMTPRIPRQAQTEPHTPQLQTDTEKEEVTYEELDCGAFLSKSTSCEYLQPMGHTPTYLLMPPGLPERNQGHGKVAPSGKMTDDGEFGWNQGHGIVAPTGEMRDDDQEQTQGHRKVGPLTEMTSEEAEQCETHGRVGRPGEMTDDGEFADVLWPYNAPLGEHPEDQQHLQVERPKDDEPDESYEALTPSIKIIKDSEYTKLAPNCKNCKSN